MRLLVVFLCLSVPVLGGRYMVLQCEKGSDCARDECCVLNATTNIVSCQPMRTNSQRCYVNQPYAWSRPEEMILNYDLCPCTTGEFCGPMHWPAHPVYGPVGACTFG